MTTNVYWIYNSDLRELGFSGLNWIFGVLELFGIDLRILES